MEHHPKRRSKRLTFRASSLSKGISWSLRNAIIGFINGAVSSTHIIFSTLVVEGHKCVLLGQLLVV